MRKIMGVLRYWSGDVSSLVPSLHFLIMVSNKVPAKQGKVLFYQVVTVIKI